VALSRFVVTSRVIIGWPANWAQMTNGAPVPLAVAISNPSAGANFTYTVPAGPPVSLQSINATLVTSAAVANRRVLFQVRDGSGTLQSEFQGSGIVPASTTLNAFLSLGNTNNPNSTSGISLGPVAPVTMQPGWTVTSAITLIDAADQLSAITIGVLPTSAGEGAANIPQAIFDPGTVIVADSSAGSTGPQLLYQMIGGGNLRAYVQGQDDVSHWGLSN
jgi:hypothetical protein